ncbi:MAG TPA: hypothetical protein VKV37_06360 [Ktedonobacteraceae bacterium]|nr:hypothetical protein [Ktedonobacteraceae bacterium]
MQAPNRPIFRKSAVDHYMRSEEETTRLRLGSARTPILLWCLLGCFLVIGAMAWLTQIPIYVSGTGIALGEGNQLLPGYRGALAAVFLPVQQSTLLHAGQPVRLRIAADPQELSSQIVEVEPATTDPGAFCKQYAPASVCSHLISGPAIVVIVGLGDAPASLHAGSVLAAQIRVGALRIVSLL